MVSEYVYSPHVDFFIDRVDRDTGYEMASFHIHHKYEIYYEIEGSRRYFIEDAAYIVNAGSVVLIGENQIHKTAALGDGASSRIVVNFSREYLDKITDLFPEVDFFSFLSEEHNHLLSTITVKQQNHIHGILQQLLTLQEETSPEADAMRKMLLATLLLELKELCRQQQEKGGDSGRVSNHIVDQIQAYIAEHYAEKLTLTGIASQFYISPYYLSRLFRRVTGQSIVDYLNNRRIEAAQKLLETTELSISAIAEQTGFASAAHFRRVFREVMDISPLQYRKKNRE